KAGNAVEEASRTLEAKRQEIAAKRREIEIKNQAAIQKENEAKQKLETVNKELIDLQTKRGEYDRLEIRAPRTGVIQQWFGVEGSDTVKEGDKLFVIVPEATELAVELKLKGNDIPLIKVGDDVRLQFEGWPAVQFVGWPSVAVGTFGGKVNRIFPTDDGKGNFRVLVSPHKTESDLDWPDDRYLRQGVRANGWVLLKQVPLGYEIWRQLNGFPPTVTDESADKDKSKGGKVKLPKA
ncbi:MAG: HlyD family efflux transporter periplasmic adaptor subunit, partial [Planctomycetales bacterium]|nr:HlyD family efflux transporter periplasmic adaptor subunit [Planctomycetales bacterium]